jgi:aromatic-L-amino-acid decarboxylase
VTERPAPVPDLDWEPARARAFTDRTADLYQELLERLPDLPVSRQWTQEEVRAGVAFDIPDAPMPDDDLFDYLHRVVFDWSVYMGHPRFYAYITGAGTVPGAAADLLASGINMNNGGWQLSGSATEIELQLGRWFATEMFDLPEGSGATLTSGGAMANFIALKAARDRRAGWDVRRLGVAGGPPLVLYLSEETHVVSERAADMLGLGTDNVRHVAVDDGFRMRVDALETAIDEDLAADRRPFAVVGSAGTVATGAVDPLHAIADLCAARDLWFHVDAAYGGPARLAPDLRPLMDGIERADSIAFDPHKWMYTPLVGGCVVMRDMRHFSESFDMYASYVVQDKDHTGHGMDLGRNSPNFSRQFASLKILVSLLAHGRSAYARRISQDAALARYLGELVREREAFELATPPSLSICCFRYVPLGLAGDDAAREAYLSALNQELMTRIQSDGRVFCSNAILGDRFVLRVCIVNYRTEAPDVEALLDVAAELGAKIDADMRPDALR